MLKLRDSQHKLKVLNVLEEQRAYAINNFCCALKQVIDSEEGSPQRAWGEQWLIRTLEIGFEMEGLIEKQKRGCAREDLPLKLQKFEI